MAIRPHRHLRNRAPRPNSINSPPAGIELISARSTLAPSNSTECILSNPVQSATGATTEFHDYTSGQDSIGILFGSPQPSMFTIIWPTSLARVGHIIGWDTAPTVLVAMQLAVTKNERFTVTE